MELSHFQSSAKMELLLETGVIDIYKRRWLCLSPLAFRLYSRVLLPNFYMFLIFYIISVLHDPGALFVVWFENDTARAIIFRRCVLVLVFEVLVWFLLCSIVLIKFAAPILKIVCMKKSVFCNLVFTSRSTIQLGQVSALPIRYEPTLTLYELGKGWQKVNF